MSDDAHDEPHDHPHDESYEHARPRRGLGYRPDTHDKSQDPGVRQLLGGARRLPEAFTLEPYIAAIHDQGQTSSCVGWAFAQAVELRMRVVGTPTPLPSPVAIYTFARALERGRAEAGPLADEGSMPARAVQGMREWGLPSFEQWPFDPAHINDEPKLDDLEEASATLFTGFYRISSGGSQRLFDIRHALSEGYPVAVGTAVDEAFEKYGPKSRPLPAPNARRALGGHMMHLVGYDAAGNFRGRNQWGTGWGDRGMFWASPEWVASDLMSDVYVLTAQATGR